MLTYTSEKLKEPLSVVGPVKAILYGLSSAPDTDWVVRLCDVWPDGRSISVCDGILRGRYRNSSECEELMVPDQIYRFEVDLWATAQTFLPGHRIRVQVTSSDFPRYDRNLNTGGPFGEEVLGQVAANTIFHDALRSSHVVLPIMS
jgi:putative CocE/NonD family hydrolase